LLADAEVSCQRTALGEAADLSIGECLRPSSRRVADRNSRGHRADV